MRHGFICRGGRRLCLRRGARQRYTLSRAALAAYLDLGEGLISRGPAGAAAAGAGARARARAGLLERPVPVRRVGAGAGSFYSPDLCAAAATAAPVPPLAETRRPGARRVSTLRPAWFKAVVWFDERETGPLQARAKFLLDRRDLTALRGPLTELRAALRDEPALAVATRHDLLAADRARRGLRGGDESHLRDAQARDADAARVEALALHRVYRLVARAGEALALLDVLLRARDAEDRTNWAAAKDAPPPQPPKIPSLALVVIGPTTTKKPEQKPCTAVDAHLKPLAGLTLRELVCSRKAHELVRGCLRALVAPSHRTRSSPTRGPTTWRGNWARRVACSFGRRRSGPCGFSEARKSRKARFICKARRGRPGDQSGVRGLCFGR